MVCFACLHCHYVIKLSNCMLCKMPCMTKQAEAKCPDQDQHVLSNSGRHVEMYASALIFKSQSGHHQSS